MDGLELDDLVKAGDMYDEELLATTRVLPRLVPLVGMAPADFGVFGMHIELKDVIPANARSFLFETPQLLLQASAQATTISPTLLDHSPVPSTPATPAKRTIRLPSPNHPTPRSSLASATAFDLTGRTAAASRPATRRALSTTVPSSTSTPSIQAATASAINAINLAVQDSANQHHHRAEAASAPAKGSC
jgi:hypothetical protein